MGLLNFQVRVHIHGQVNLRSCNNINIKSGNETTATATTPTEKNMTGNNVSNKQSFRRHNVEGNKNERHSYTKVLEWDRLLLFSVVHVVITLLPHPNRFRRSSTISFRLLLSTFIIYISLCIACLYIYHAFKFSSEFVQPYRCCPALNWGYQN